MFSCSYGTQGQSSVEAGALIGQYQRGTRQGTGSNFTDAKTRPRRTGRDRQTTLLRRRVGKSRGTAAPGISAIPRLLQLGAKRVLTHNVRGPGAAQNTLPYAKNT